MSRYVYVWLFEVAAKDLDEFLRYYGPTGIWAELFRQGEGYIETILLQDQECATRLITLDRWASAEALDAFLLRYRAEYDRIDRRCQSLTLSERRLGSYWERA